MQDDDYINILNIEGCLSSSFLIKTFKLTLESSREVIKNILHDYENISVINADQIYIEGRKPIIKIPRRKSKWKLIK